MKVTSMKSTSYCDECFLLLFKDFSKKWNINMTIEIDAGSSASDTPSTHEEIERVKCKLGNAL